MSSFLPCYYVKYWLVIHGLYFVGYIFSTPSLRSLKNFFNQDWVLNLRKGIQIGKEVILSLFADDIILHIENHKDAARTLQEIINEFGQVAGYK